MLDHLERRPAFDAFFRSLPDTAQIAFMDAALTQWRGLQDDEPNRVVSLIDCMENVWDLWRELPGHTPRMLSMDERAIAHVMDDNDRHANELRFQAMALPYDDSIERAERAAGA